MSDYYKAAKMTFICVLVAGLALPPVWAVGSFVTNIGATIFGGAVEATARKVWAEEEYKNLPNSVKEMFNEERAKKASDMSKARRKRAYEQGNIKGG